MIGLNPGGTERQVHDEVMTRWVYKTTDSVAEILASENYFHYLNYSQEKINTGDYILIISQPPSGEMEYLETYVGEDLEAEAFFPIYLKSINLHTGKVTILSGLEDYIEEED